MLQFALAFVIGNGVVQAAPGLDSPWIAVGALSAFAALFTKLRRPVILAFLVGIVWVLLQAHWRLAGQLSPDLEGRDLLLRGHIASLPESESYGTRFRFAPDKGQPVRTQLELTWYERSEVRAGEYWQLQVRLKRPHGFANPGGHDYEAQLFREGIGAAGYVRDSAQNLRLSGASSRYWLLRARAWLIERIVLALPQDPQQGVVRGLVVGDQQAISSEQWRIFARTGISHLVAISGLHIGMIALLAAWLGGRLVHWPRMQQRRIAKPDLQAVCGIAAALGYSLLAGMSVPTQRTLIMLCVFLGARLLRRPVDVWQSFSVALLAVVLADPFATLAIGAWLSFGAVALILLSFGSRLGRRSMLVEFLQTQAVVSVGLLPLLLAGFGAVSLVSPVTNLFAIPLYTLVVVPMALLGTGLAGISPPLGTGLLQGCAWLLAKAELGLRWMAALPLAAWHFPQPAAWAVALMAAGAVLMIAPLIWPLRYTGLLLCLPAACWHEPPLPAGAFSLTLLDVGQGLAAVVRTREHALLYDAGPVFRSGRDTGELVVLPFLHASGLRRLDAVLASHGDSDHIGGLSSVLEGTQVRRLLRGPSVPAMPGSELCVQGGHWKWDGVEFRILHPDVSGIIDSDNDSSCVLQITGPGGRALLLGDIEQSAERRLLERGLVMPAELVVAAHHGSRSSSTQAFVDAVQARYVLFSAGYRNRWGFPKAEVLERWGRRGARSFSTIESGALTVTFGTERLAAPQEYRKQHPHYWRTRR